MPLLEDKQTGYRDLCPSQRAITLEPSGNMLTNLSLNALKKHRVTLSMNVCVLMSVCVVGERKREADGSAVFPRWVWSWHTVNYLFIKNDLSVPVLLCTWMIHVSESKGRPLCV